MEWHQFFYFLEPFCCILASKLVYFDKFSQKCYFGAYFRLIFNWIISSGLLNNFYIQIYCSTCSSWSVYKRKKLFNIPLYTISNEITQKYIQFYWKIVKIPYFYQVYAKNRVTLVVTRSFCHLYSWNIDIFLSGTGNKIWFWTNWFLGAILTRNHT